MTELREIDALIDAHMRQCEHGASCTPETCSACSQLFDQRADAHDR
jgi:hypothetical protein